MGVSNSKLVQVLPPEGGGNGHVLMARAQTHKNGRTQTSAPETNKSSVALNPTRSFRNANLQGSMDPVIEIPNQRARVRQSLLEPHLTSNNGVPDCDETSGLDNEVIVAEEGIENEHEVVVTGEDTHDQLSNKEITKEDGDSIISSVTPILSRALYDGQLNVKQTEDSARCDVTGCVVFGDDRIAITDNWNGCVKVFALKERRFLSDIHLDMKPWDITAMSPGQLVTTCNNTLVTLNVHPKNGDLTLDRVIPIEGRSRGIAFANESFIVTFVQPEAAVKLIDNGGNVLVNINTHITGVRLFKRPEYVTVDAERALIYVTDFQTHSVSCLSMDGEVISLYKDEDLKKPTGVAVDGKGNVLVSGWGSENIHKVSSKRCERIQTVLQSRDIITYPQALAFYADTMYISHYHFTSANNYLSAYSLEEVHGSIDIDEQ